MKTILLLVLLGMSAWNARAQPVAASSDTLAFAPVLVPGESPWRSVVFTSSIETPIVVYGLGSRGPFGFVWQCSGGDNGVLPPRGTCELSGRFVAAAGQPLGLAEGLVGFRLSTGTILVDLVGFAYTTQPLEGIGNLRTSLAPLGFDADLIPWLVRWLDVAEAALLDDVPSNDHRACGALQVFVQRIIHEAAKGGVSDWSAASLGVQEAAISQGLGCGPRPPAA